MQMEIYRMVDMYGDGIVLINPKTINENNYNLHKNDRHWKYIGKQLFSDEILKKLDVQKTLDELGLIDLTYME